MKLTIRYMVAFLLVLFLSTSAYAQLFRRSATPLTISTAVPLAPASAQLFGSSTTRQPMFPASQSLNGAAIVASDWFSVSGSSSFSFYQTLTTSTAVPFITALGAIDSLDYSVRLSFHDSQSKPALADSGFVFAADTTNFILLRTITAHDTTRQGKKIYQLSTAQYEGTFRWVRAYFIKGSKILSKGTPTLNSQLDLVTIQ